MEDKIKVKIKILIKDDYGKPLTIFDLFPSIDKEKFDFVISEDPDFVIYNQSGNSEFFQYKCVRISLDGERYTPDFNICDYAITDDVLEFGDRHVRKPYLAAKVNRRYLDALKIQGSPVTKSDLQNKDLFCNFIYSNDIADSMRKILFNKISEYKRVDSGGKLFNNIGYRIGGGIGDYDEKIRFQSRCKFTLAVENIRSPGHTSEKILHAFAAGTVPIYWGDPLIDQYFNPKAMINCDSFNSHDELLEYVRKVDQDEELYLEIVNQPILNPSFDFAGYDRKCAEFLEHIFSQEPEKAFRRERTMYALLHEIDLMKGRRIRERKRRIEKMGAKAIERMGLHSMPLIQWYKSKFYYR